jgi:AcrR family transcriptional regulator
VSSGTRQQILDTARGLFNAQGLHRVGVRDVARALGMSPGNLAYHFPTQDDLVAALWLELHEQLARTLIEPLPEKIPFATFYRTVVLAMRSILPYRFVLLSHLDARLSTRAQQRERDAMRERVHARDRRLLSGLIAAKHLDSRQLEQAPYLQEQADLISSGWLAAAQGRGWSDDEQIVFHYAKVGTALLAPFCTASGARQLRRVLAGALDASLAPRPPEP